MRNYNKTKWVDGETPINAAALNKIESGISGISGTALSASDIKGGDNVRVDTNSDGTIKISAKTGITSDTVTGIECITELPETFDPGKIYFLIKGGSVSGLYVGGIDIWPK